MALGPGARLGSFEIVALVGAGGMGEVYRARDAKLGRDVAIKVLPDAFAGDRDRLTRFEREARTLASLNHPNIAQIHGVLDQPPALVMEFAEGDDLSQLISHGALPLDELLPVATQLVDALDAAHEQGIVHRDLKPANIKVTPQGAVKVLDFGLARAMDPAAGVSGDAMNSPTLTSPFALSQAGVILGTAAYMSPEQAKGQPVDKRTDIWAFGCVLFEMLSGRAPFRGDGGSDTIAAVLRTEPDWSMLPTSTSLALRRLLRHCLEKDPRRRLADIRDARIELADAVALPRETVSAGSHRPWLPWAIACASALVTLTLIGLMAGDVLPRRSTNNAAPVIHLTLLGPPGEILASPAISPDGRAIVFAASGAQTARLWLQSLDDGVAKPLAGTESPSFPFWSPDSRSVGFFASGKLKTVALDSGAVTTICDAPVGRGGAWSSRGVILFAPNTSGPLQVVSAAGGAPRPATTVSTSQDVDRWPLFMPDGNHFLFDHGVREGTAIYAGSLDSLSPIRVVDNAYGRAAFIPPDVLLYPRGTAIFAQSFDAARLAVRGEPIALHDAGGVTDLGETRLSASATGVLVTWQAPEPPIVKLAWVDRNGSASPLPLAGAQYMTISLSPDGGTAALTRFDEGRLNIWLYDMAREALRRLTSEGQDTNPVWSPDGQFVIFHRLQNKPPVIMKARADGSGRATVLIDNDRPGSMFPGSWTAAGDAIAFMNVGHVFVRRGDGIVEQVAKTGANEGEPTFSPDGHWLAYRANVTGRNEIWVERYPSDGGRWQISTEGGSHPRWTPDGRELVFVSGTHFLTASTELGGSFKNGPPRPLFDLPLLKTSADWPYAISTEGKRFLALLQDSAAPTVPPHINVIVNWQAELSRSLHR